jgi:hypothetical protein
VQSWLIFSSEFSTHFSWVKQEAVVLILLILCNKIKIYKENYLAIGNLS